ncbi:MAG TPA: DUF5683 domain-containing protein [Chitinophagaceae bacterium]|nr:DUF5683 domain-containing protein [Chitinophagaceae bacterium]
MLILTSAHIQGQQKKDSAVTVADTVRAAAKKAAADTAKVKKKRSEPGKASLRSAIIPGWGQAYNKKYWKLPIVYGALAVPVITFTYNNNWYKKTREAYSIRYYNDTSKVSDLPTDGIDPSLQPLSTESLQIYRNQFRKNMDLSVLAFLAIWGLQVADAAVDAHLKSFNVNDDLSLKIKPTISPGGSKGVSLVLTYRDTKPKTSLIGF